MKITCKTADLKTALNFTGKIISKSTVIPVLEGYLIEAKGKAITITTTDLENAATKGIPVSELEGAFPFVLTFGAAQFIKAMTAETITINIDKNFAINITCGNKTGKFTGEDSINYPKLPIVENDKVEVISDDFQKAIDRSLKYISTDDLRPAMTGLFFGKDQICTTDAHRLYTYTHGLKLKDEFIVPAKTAGMMIKLKDCKMKVQTGNSVTHIAFYNKTTMLITRAIEARYPDYKCVIPTDNKKGWKVNKAALKEAITTVAIAANQSTKQVGLTINSHETIIAAQDVDFGMEANDTLKSTISNVTDYPFKIAFNSTFLLNLVADTTGDDVTLLFDTATRAGIMKQDKELILLMPLMLNEGISETKHATKAQAVNAEEESDLKDDEPTEDEIIAAEAAEEAMMD